MNYLKPIIAKIFAAVVFSLPALGISIANAEDLSLTPYKIVYAVKYSIAKGKLAVELNSDGSNTYTTDSRLVAEGMAKAIISKPVSEHAEFEIRENLVHPVSYLLNDGTDENKDGVKLEYDWESSKATMTSSDGVESKPLELGTMDHLIMQSAAALAVKGGESDFTYLSLAPGKDLQPQNFKFLGEETIGTKIGEIKTVKYSQQREGSSRTTFIWFSTEHDFVPVQLERVKDKKTVSTLKLNSLEQ